MKGRSTTRRERQPGPGSSGQCLLWESKNVHAEVITTGTELLLGEIVNTNAAYLAQQLAHIGLDLYYQTTVGDNETRISAAIKLAMQRSDVIITTGGLGPTVDDVTRQAVARATARELILEPRLLKQIQCFFEKRGRQMGENNQRQAYVPRGAIIIENPVGTAPAFIVETESAAIVALPGVPYEMRHLTETRVLPYLRHKLGLTGVIKSKVLRTCGIGESRVDQLVGDLMRQSNPTVGLAAHPGQTDVRITAKADGESAADALIARTEAQLRTRLGDFVYGTDRQTLEAATVQLLREQAKTIALAETNLGVVTQRLGSVPGSPEVFRGTTLGSNSATLLKRLGTQLDPEEASQVEDFALALRIASATREVHRADYGLAVLACEAQGSQASYEASVALVGPGTKLRRTITSTIQNPGTIEWVGNTALDMLRRALLNLPQL